MLSLVQGAHSFVELEMCNFVVGVRSASFSKAAQLLCLLAFLFFSSSLFLGVLAGSKFNVGASRRAARSAWRGEPYCVLCLH